MGDSVSRARKARRDDILEAIPEHHGNVAALCDALGFSRTTFYVYRDDFPEIEKKLDEERESVGERVEHKLIEKALNGDNTCMIFYLKTQRQWSETRRVEMDARVESVSSPEEVEEFNQRMAEWEQAMGADEDEA